MHTDSSINWKEGYAIKISATIINIVKKRCVQEIKNNTLNYASNIGLAVTGKIFINAAAINDLTSTFSQKFIEKMISEVITTTIYSIGGSTLWVIYTSEWFRVGNYEVYSALRVAGDLDIFYFLVEAYAGTLLDALIIKRKNLAIWDEILMKLSSELGEG